MDKTSEKELFETMPVHKAVAALAIPSNMQNGKNSVASLIFELRRGEIAV